MCGVPAPAGTELFHYISRLGVFRGDYLVTDHYACYNDVPRDQRQLCWAHLIRHFIQISEHTGKAAEMGQRLLLIGYAVFRTHHHFSKTQISQTIYERRMHRLRRCLQKTLAQGTELSLAKRTANQCRHLLKDEAMCWTFLQHPDIPLTNNTAERAIRPYVIWRKLSFASQDSQGDHPSSTVRSVSY